MRGGMRERKRAVTLGAIAVLVTVVVAGCGGGSSGSSGASGSGGTTTIKVGVPGTYGTMIGLYLARDKGYFTKQGLNVQIIPFKGDAPAVKALVGGAVDINVASLAGLLQGVQHGAPLKAIYGGFDQTMLQWYGKKPIDWSNVKGTRWGVSSPGSSTDFMTRFLLHQHGVSAKDVNIVSTGGSAGDVSALKSGQVDYVITAPELGTQLQNVGGQVVARQSDLMREYPFHVVYGKTSWLASNHDAVTRFLRGLVQGMKFSLSNTSAGVQEEVKVLRLPQAVAKQTYSTNVNSKVHPDGALPDPKSMSTFWQIGIENGLFSKRLPESQWLDSDWIDSYPSWMK